MATGDECSSCSNSFTPSTESFQTKIAYFTKSFDAKLNGECKVDNNLKSMKDFPRILRPNKFEQKNAYKKQEFEVGTLFQNIHCRSTSGTQATALMNKCFQATHNGISKTALSGSLESSSWTTCSTVMASGEISPFNEPTFHDEYDNNCNHKYRKAKSSEQTYLGNSKNKTKVVGVALSGKRSQKRQNNSKTSIQAKGSNQTSDKKNTSSTGMQTKAPSQTSGVQTKQTSLQTVPSSTKSNTSQCNKSNQDMSPNMRNQHISHIRIGPRSVCPVEGTSPCIGPKCKEQASKSAASPVKIQTGMVNPRRGVFEIVVRRAGAPKNELMLEWTPPPSSPCSPPCRPKYRMIM